MSPMITVSNRTGSNTQTKQTNRTKMDVGTMSVLVNNHFMS